MPSPLTATILNNFINRFNPTFTTDIGSLYINACTIENIAQDIAFCQACFITENFTSINHLTNFNPGGIAGSGSGGLHPFANWTDGVRGHVQHLLKYGTTRTYVAPLVDPRWSFVTAGVAPTVDQLQNKYSNQIGYSSAIKNKMIDLYKFVGFDNPIFIN